METEEKKSPVPKTVGKEKENHFKKLGQIISKYLEFGSDSKPKDVQVQPAPTIAKLPILQFLKPIPWILCGLFAFSFVWDFQGIGTEIFGLSLQVEGLIRIISVSGLIGYLTN